MFIEILSKQWWKQQLGTGYIYDHWASVIKMHDYPNSSCEQFIIFITAIYTGPALNERSKKVYSLSNMNGI